MYLGHLTRKVRRRSFQGESGASPEFFGHGHLSFDFAREGCGRVVMHSTGEMGKIDGTGSRDGQILGMAADDAEGFDQSPQETKCVGYVAGSLRGKDTGLLKPVNRVERAGHADAGIGMADFDLFGLDEVLQIDKAAEAVLGARGAMRDELCGLAVAKVLDVFIVDRPARINEGIAGLADPIGERGVANDWPELNECEALELARFAAAGKILRKAFQRAGERTSFAVRTEAQVNFKYALAARPQCLQEGGDEFFEVARVGNGIWPRGAACGLVDKQQFDVRRVTQLETTEFTEAEDRPSARTTCFQCRRAEPLLKSLVTDAARFFDDDFGEVCKLLRELSELDPARNVP